MTRLVPVHRKLLEYSRQYEMEFTCSVQKTSGSYQPFRLSARLLLLVGYVGAGIEYEVSD